MSARPKEINEATSRAEGAKMRPKAADVSQSSSPQDLTVETSHGAISVRQTMGASLPVLFLHGNSSSKDIFNAQFQSALGQRYRMAALDLPGHGASSDARDPDRSYSIPGYADATIETLEVLGIEETVLVGWSLGGHVALEMAARCSKILGIMLIATPPVAHGLESLQQAFRPNPVASFFGAAELSETQLRQLAEGIAGVAGDREIEDALRRADGRTRALMFKGLLEGAFVNERHFVETSDIPIAVVGGAEDPFVNGDYLANVRFANLWSKSRHVIPRSGHAPFRDSTEVFNTLLASFLNDMSARAKSTSEAADRAADSRQPLAGAGHRRS
jgi:pimeloyl-ACP methyl ester carboxylesterase